MFSNDRFFFDSLDGLPFQSEEFDFVYVVFFSVLVDAHLSAYRHIKRIALGVPEDRVCQLLE